MSMIFNTIPDHKLIRREILFGDYAYIERDTGLLFVPLVDEVWLNLKTKRQIRILANHQHRYNVKSPYFVNYFRKVVFQWNTLFLADPQSMFIKEI